ncbi:hypothetical protein DFH11DRAFT_1635705 [Phellopilus nigrolimitatus]|nr:hypothetical protein DFH11DRAFT_1635705 [Phellopilus nigrolimitatus]
MSFDFEDENVFGEFGKAPFVSSNLLSGVIPSVFNFARRESEDSDSDGFEYLSEEESERSSAPVGTPELSQSPNISRQGSLSPDTIVLSTNATKNAAESDFPSSSYHPMNTDDPRMLSSGTSRYSNDRPKYERTDNYDDPDLNLLFNPPSRSSIPGPQRTTLSSTSCVLRVKQEKPASSISMYTNAFKPPTAISTEGSFACDYEGCGRTYRTSQSLKSHALTHNGNRYFCACGLDSECVRACEKKGWSKYVHGSVKCLLRAPA